MEEGELEVVPVRRSLKELIPVRAGGGGEEEVAERVSRARASRKGRRPGPWGSLGKGAPGRAPEGRGRQTGAETGEREKGRPGARKWVLRGLEEEGSERLGDRSADPYLPSWAAIRLTPLFLVGHGRRKWRRCLIAPFPSSAFPDPLLRPRLRAPHVSGPLAPEAGSRERPLGSA